MEHKGYFFPDDLKYEKNHFWAKIDGDLVIMGASEFITKQAGDITYVGLPEEGDEVTVGKPCGSIESGKWVGRIYAVVSGTIEEVNMDLEDEPEKLNEDPYSGAWICKINPTNLDDDFGKLMAPDTEYLKYIDEEIHKIETGQKK